MLSESLKREFLSKFAGAVLVREEPLLPVRVVLRHCTDPLDRHHPLGVFVRRSVLMRIGPRERLRPEWHLHTIRRDSCDVEADGWSGNYADADVAGLRDIHPNARTFRQCADRLRIELATAGGDEAELPRIVP